jgi:dolichol-phosphate mannosyltransferase
MMFSPARRSRLFLASAILLFCACAGVVWLQQGPTDQEQLANVSKALDFARNASLSNPFPWWTSDYLGGHSAAGAAGTILSYLAILLGAALGGIITGPKLVALAAMGMSAVGMAAAMRQVTPCRWTAAAAGVLYLVSPQLSLSFGAKEHYVVGFALALIPWVTWALVRHARERTRRTLLTAALASAGLMLVNLKTAVVFAPFAALLFAWARCEHGEPRGGLFRELMLFFGTVLALAGFAVFPMLREGQWMTFFEGDPFEGWQRTFALKTLLEWFDWGGMVLTGMPEDFVVARGRFYAGSITLVSCAAILWSPGLRQSLHQTPEGRSLKFALLLALLAAWCSFGIRSPFAAFLHTVHSASNLRDWAAPFILIVLALPVLIFMRCFKPGKWHRLQVVVASLVFHLVPPFLLIGWMPGFDRLRAPWAFWECAGPLICAMAGALALRMVLQRLRENRLRKLAVLAACALVLVDVAPAIRHFESSRMNPAVFADFKAASDHLKANPLSGKVLSLSGRYFDLLIPAWTGRPLVLEAFHKHYGLRWQNDMVMLAAGTADQVRGSLRLLGVSHVLMDKTDPDIPEELRTYLRSLFSVDFENGTFVVLRNEDRLFPAFSARDYVAVQDSGKESAALSIAAFRHGLLGLAADGSAPAYPHLAGIATKGKLELSPAFRDRKPKPLKLLDVKKVGPSRFEVASAGGPGWVVLSETFHPDWTAHSAGVQMRVHRAAGSQVAVFDAGGAGPIEFRYRAPFWYGLLLTIAVVGWVGFSSFLALRSLPFFPSRIRSWWNQPFAIMPEKPPPASETLAAIERPLVVVPTYNESETVPALLEKLFALPRRCDVLIVDDGSPDGTASIVKQHSAFGTRLHLLERTSKQGLGTAYRAGFAWALERDYDACIEIDADGSHDPADIPRLLEALDEGCDLAIGSRYVGGVRVLNWPQSRLFLSTFAGWYTSFLTRLPLTDPTSGFKAIRRHVIERLDWSRFTSGGYSFQIELHYFAWKAGFLLREIPIIFTERREGQSKMSLEIAMEAARRVITLLFERSRR